MELLWWRFLFKKGKTMKHIYTLEYQLYTTCNLSCSYCYNYFKEGMKSFEYYKKQLDKIKDLHDGTNPFILNGGEPFLFKDLGKLFNYVDKDYMLTFTNANLHIDYYKDFMKQLDDYSKMNVVISLHIDDIIDFDNILKVIKFLNSYITVAVSIVITETFAKNIDNYKKHLDLIHQVGSKNVIVIFEDDLLESKDATYTMMASKEFKDFENYLDKFNFANCTLDSDFKSYRETFNNLRVSCKLDNFGSGRVSQEIVFLEKDGEMLIETTLNVSDNKLTAETYQELKDQISVIDYQPIDTLYNAFRR